MSDLSASFDAELFGGISIITGQAIRKEANVDDNTLYRHRSQETPSESTFTFKAIPYYLWANREPGEMRVWIHSN